MNYISYILFTLCTHTYVQISACVTTGGSSGAGPSAGLSQEEFPELPGMSKAAKKKARQQQTPLTAQLRSANMPVRVINRTTPASSSGGRGSNLGVGTVHRLID